MIEYGTDRVMHFSRVIQTNCFVSLRRFSFYLGGWGMGGRKKKFDSYRMVASNTRKITRRTKLRIFQVDKNKRKKIS